MKGLENTTFLVLYICSNAIACIMLWASWKQPRLARLMFFLLFAWASATNWSYAIRAPQVYLGYAELSFSDPYTQFINGWFSRHITETVGFVATSQALMAVCMLLKGRLFKMGSIAAIIFLLAIIPLGVGSGFPCTLIMAAALFVLLVRHDHDFIWKGKPLNMFKSKWQTNEKLL